MGEKTLKLTEDERDYLFGVLVYLKVEMKDTNNTLPAVIKSKRLVNIIKTKVENM